MPSAFYFRQQISLNFERRIGIFCPDFAFLSKTIEMHHKILYNIFMFMS